jgi:hypothetical protein
MNPIYQPSIVALRKIVHDPKLFPVLEIMLCLRSCDEGELPSPLKEFTVERLRAVTGLEHGNIRVGPLTQVEMDQRDELLTRVGFHFYQHWKWAVEGTKEVFQYDLENERPCEGLENTSISGRKDQE